MLKSVVRFSLVLLLGLALTACQAATSYYLGAKADGMESVVLKSGNYHWQDLYVTVDYRLQQQADKLGIDGVLTFSDNPRVSYTVSRDLKLKLFQLDKDKRVVSYADIARVLNPDLEADTRFAREVPLHKDTVSLAFGYEGVLFAKDPDYPTSDMIWKLPRRGAE
ncbi:MAG: hypothetical protein C0622_03650 [Desulfuromonas sp.]|nr:MAG: hypothetical protein C0622_03650 [Desulfuromonas sp.]